MPKIHLQSNETTAVCNWPWNDEAANFEIIEKFEIDCWLTEKLTEVTCSKCRKQFEKTGRLEPIEIVTTGWAVKASRVTPDIKGFNTFYVISMKKDGTLKVGSTIDMAKLYKTENNALKVCNKINEGEALKAEIIQVD